MNCWTIHLFGPEARLAGRDRVEVHAPAQTLDCARLRVLLSQAQPELATRLSSCRWAVNHAYADESTVVSPQDEVGLIGMVSGG